MTLPKISLFEHTEASFAEMISQRLGRGAQHASKIYSQLMRANVIDRTDTFFNNSQRLVDEIESHIDFTLPTLSSQKRGRGDR